MNWTEKKFYIVRFIQSHHSNKENTRADGNPTYEKQQKNQNKKSMTSQRITNTYSLYCLFFISIFSHDTCCYINSHCHASATPESQDIWHCFRSVSWQQHTNLSDVDHKVSEKNFLPFIQSLGDVVKVKMAIPNDILSSWYVTLSKQWANMPPAIMPLYVSENTLMFVNEGFKVLNSSSNAP